MSESAWAKSPQPFLCVPGQSIEIRIETNSSQVFYHTTSRPINQYRIEKKNRQLLRAIAGLSASYCRVGIPSVHISFLSGFHRAQEQAFKYSEDPLGEWYLISKTYHPAALVSFPKNRCSFTDQFAKTEESLSFEVTVTPREYRRYAGIRQVRGNPFYSFLFSLPAPLYPHQLTPVGEPASVRPKVHLLPQETPLVPRRSPPGAV